MDTTINALDDPRPASTRWAATDRVCAVVVVRVPRPGAFPDRSRSACGPGGWARTSVTWELAIHPGRRAAEPVADRPVRARLRGRRDPTAGADPGGAPRGDRARPGALRACRAYRPRGMLLSSGTGARPDARWSKMTQGPDGVGEPPATPGLDLPRFEAWLRRDAARAGRPRPAVGQPDHRRPLEPHLPDRRGRAAAGAAPPAARARARPPPTTWAASTGSSPRWGTPPSRCRATRRPRRRRRRRPAAPAPPFFVMDPVAGRGAGPSARRTPATQRPGCTRSASSWPGCWPSCTRSNRRRSAWATSAGPTGYLEPAAPPLADASSTPPARASCHGLDQLQDRLRADGAGAVPGRHRARRLPARQRPGRTPRWPRRCRGSARSWTGRCPRSATRWSTSGCSGMSWSCPTIMPAGAVQRGRPGRRLPAVRRAASRRTAPCSGPASRSWPGTAPSPPTSSR